ncbi:hypothetical protein HZY83_07535 [Gemella sp. GH3]|uniref:hypothetical protein n=1 Tax=unclassified Gemella TaxID=2624949 RepID=UPI0015CFE659|nr:MULTISPECIES: hypothetical protein [unclassified Gemella]MBF0714526.1 hypothetical protein [Gemella sp. GH3.1]NYS51478.1 hypothetical protein [Gemella sp. GH3]
MISYHRKAAYGDLIEKKTNFTFPSISVKGYEILQKELIEEDVRGQVINETKHTLNVEIVFQDKETTLEDISSLLKKIQELCYDCSKPLKDL